jgi:hypothetical protein
MRSRCLTTAGVISVKKLLENGWPAHSSHERRDFRPFLDFNLMGVVPSFAVFETQLARTLQRRLFLGRARLKTQLVGLEVYVGVRAWAVRKDLTRVGAFSGQAVFDP